MDAVIRSVALSSQRTRLGGAPGEDLPPGAVTSAHEEAVQAVERARALHDHERVRIADALRREMAEEASRIFEQERLRGHASGYESGTELARAESQRSVEALQARLDTRIGALLDAIDERHRASIEQVRAMSIDIAFAAVCRILGEQSVSAASVAGCVTEQLAQLPHSGPVVVRLHPADLRLLGDLAPSRLAAGRAVSLQADDTLVLGGCVLETEAGQYDASLDTQLRRLKALLDQHRATPSPEHTT